MSCQRNLLRNKSLLSQLRRFIPRARQHVPCAVDPEYLEGVRSGQIRGIRADRNVISPGYWLQSVLEDSMKPEVYGHLDVFETSQICRLFLQVIETASGRSEHVSQTLHKMNTQIETRPRDFCGLLVLRLICIVIYTVYYNQGASFTGRKSAHDLN